MQADLIIEMSVGIVKSHPAIAILGVVEVVIKLAMFVGWILAFATLSGRMGVGVDFLLFVGLMWTCQVVHYTAYTATSGVTATWYDGHRRANPNLSLNLTHECCTTAARFHLSQWRRGLKAHQRSFQSPWLYLSSSLAHSFFCLVRGHQWPRTCESVSLRHNA
jgi:hypothetical protein